MSSNQPARRRLAELRLDEFVLPGARVVDEDSFSPTELRYIEGVEDLLYIARERLKRDPSIGKELPFDRRDDIRFVAVKRAVIAIDVTTDELVGGTSQALPFVRPEHRLRGINRDLHLLADELDLSLFAPSHYSTGGYRARLAAHREAVLDAVIAGRPVHPDNLERYADLIAARQTACEPALPEL